jgi:pimeloyl-ACP methyl ester carboxylesterase
METTLRIHADGLELTVETFGDGPPLVFAHGLTGNRQGSRAQFAALAERYRVVIYDQRGHGDSTPITDPAGYDVERMADDMAAVMDALDIGRAIVGGESMGAATTLLFALRHPERVDKLLLTAPAFGDRANPDSQRLKDMGKAIATLGIDEFLKLAAVRQRDELGWSPHVIAYVAEKFRSHPPASLATALQTVPDWRVFSDLSVVSRLTCPVCLVAWENDPLHPIELARRLAATFPNARLETVRPLPAIFENPAIVANVYRKFLESQ